MNILKGWPSLNILVIVLLLAVVGALAQSKPEAKPITLSLEASQRFVELENQKSELRKAYNEVLRQQGDLLLGAGASSEQRQAIQAWQGQGKAPWGVTGQQIVIAVLPGPAVKPTP